MSRRLSTLALQVAIGLALLLGFVFPQNFNSPYRATGCRDFWRRWHMTLSRFLRDFLYIPLGGNRGSRLLTYRNLMLTMVIARRLTPCIGSKSWR